MSGTLAPPFRLNFCVGELGSGSRLRARACALLRTYVRTYFQFAPRAYLRAFFRPRPPTQRTRVRIYIRTRLTAQSIPCARTSVLAFAPRAQHQHTLRADTYVRTYKHTYMREAMAT